jgi:TetR/AcrR family transcriptional repressor of nem operon
MANITLQKPPSARERILDLAEQSVLHKGFGATSIDELIAGAGITKSGFFYHFKDKSELAKALLQRYLARDSEILDGLFTRATELHEDPLHSFLIGLKMYAEMMANLPETHPGCLVASFCYQDQLFRRDIGELNAKGVLAWRKRFRDHLEKIAARHKPRIDVDLDALADMVSTLAEGGIILSKVLKDRDVLARQVMEYRNYIRLLFSAD